MIALFWHSHQQWLRVHLSQILTDMYCFLNFWMIIILTGVRCNLFVLFIFISLTALFHMLVGHVNFILSKMPANVLYPFLNCSSYCCWDSWALIDSGYKSFINWVTCKYFSLSVDFVLFCCVFPWQYRSILTWCSHMSIFYFILCSSGVCSKKSLPMPTSCSFPDVFSIIVGCYQKKNV